MDSIDNFWNSNLLNWFRKHGEETYSSICFQNSIFTASFTYKGDVILIALVDFWNKLTHYTYRSDGSIIKETGPFRGNVSSKNLEEALEAIIESDTITLADWLGIYHYIEFEFHYNKVFAYLESNGLLNINYTQNGKSWNINYHFSPNRLFKDFVEDIFEYLRNIDEQYLKELFLQ